MSRWLEQLGTWQFALIYAIAVLVPTFLAGILIQWLLKGHLNLGFVIPYSVVFALTISTLATVMRRSRRLKRESQ